MKKILCFLAITALVFTFTACSQNDGKDLQQKTEKAIENVEQSQQPNEDVQNQKQQQIEDGQINKVKYNISDDYLGEISVFLNFDLGFFCNHEDMVSFDEVLEHRQELKDYYSVQNTNIVNSLNLSDYSYISISRYGPFIEIFYENQQKFKEADFKILKEADLGFSLIIFVEERKIGADEELH